MKTAVVVIPTYNEKESIGEMIDYLFRKTFPTIKNWSASWRMHVLIVDGSSPDGTAEVIRQKQKKYENLDLLVETKKEGIGAAYVKGFRRAMEKLAADVVIEFDGDFQHPPEIIPVLLKEIDSGYDYVIGSRKIKGGAYPKGWGLKRIFFTEVGGLMARFILFFPFKNFFKITDPTTGLKASRVKGFVDQMDMDHLYSRQFGYKLEFLYKMAKLGAKIKEVPLKFGLRTAGESKISSNTAKDVLRTAILCRWYDETTQKFLKFGIVGGFGFFINLFGLKIFNSLFKVFPWEIGVINFLANALASEIAIISNFIWNNLWTFSKEKLTSFKQITGKFITFNISSIIGGILVPSLIVGAGTQICGDQYKFLFLVIAIFCFTIPYNWIIYNKVIWKKK